MLTSCIVQAKRQEKELRLKECAAQQGGGDDQHLDKSVAEVSSGADDFLPSLLLLSCRVNPENFCSNISFIEHFRDPQMMDAECEYDLTSLQSSAHFWMTCQAAHLQMTQEEYDVAMGNTLVLSSTTSRKYQEGSVPVPDLGHVVAHTEGHTMAPVPEEAREPATSSIGESLSAQLSPFAPAQEWLKNHGYSSIGCCSIAGKILEKCHGNPEELTIGDVKTLVEECQRLVQLERDVQLLLAQP
jgi:hypothetical protein